MFINRSQSQYDFIDLDAQSNKNSTLNGINTLKLRSNEKTYNGLLQKENLLSIPKSKRNAKSESHTLQRREDNWLGKSDFNKNKISTYQNFYIAGRTNDNRNRDNGVRKINEIGTFKISGPAPILDTRKAYSQNTTKNNFYSNYMQSNTEACTAAKNNVFNGQKSCTNKTNFESAKHNENNIINFNFPSQQHHTNTTTHQNLVKNEDSNNSMKQFTDQKNPFKSTVNRQSNNYTSEENRGNQKEPENSFSQTTKDFKSASNQALTQYNNNTYMQGQIGLLNTRSQNQKYVNQKSLNETLNTSNLNHINSTGALNKTNNSESTSNNYRKHNAFYNSKAVNNSVDNLKHDKNYPSEFLLKQQLIEKQFIMKKINNNKQRTNFESHFELNKEVIDPLENKFNKTFETVSTRSKPGFNGHYSKTNQDTYNVEKEFLGDKSHSCFCVFDGHGEYGHRVAQYLKKQLFDNLSYQIKLMQSRLEFDVDKEEHIKALQKNTFLKTNDELNKKMGTCTDLSGSTGNSILIIKNKIYCANVGDSRAAILSREPKNWNLLHLSTDHVPSIPSEKQRILGCGGRIEPSRIPGATMEMRGPPRVWKKREDVPGLMMSRSFGDKVGHSIGIIVTPEITVTTYQPTYKALIVASDGVWGVVSDTIICNILAKHSKDSNSEAAAQEIIARSSNQWKVKGEYRDDITVVVAYWQKEQDFT